MLFRSKGGWKTVSASSLAFSENYDTPQSLNLAGIQKVINDFASATERSLKAGFKVIELHAAHGYLVHQFLSPLSNHRNDAYGGSFENRIRLLLEIITEVKKVWPDDLPLFVRISATDWADSGWDVEDAVKLSVILKDCGINLIDVSSGGLASYQKIAIGPGYQVPFASKIKNGAGIPTGAVGLITSATQAESILEKGETDLIVMARELLRDPYFPLHAAGELDDNLPWPSQYERAKPAK